MPRDYQIKTNNQYYIENNNIYRETLYIIRNYKGLLRQREQILYGSPVPPDGMPKGNLTSDATFFKASVLSTVETKIKAIEQTIAQMKEKYSNTYEGNEFDAYASFDSYGKFCEYRSRPNRDLAPHRKTWSRYRAEFVWNVAKKLNYF